MPTRSTIFGTTLLVLLLTAGAAQSLAGTNTVFTDDIVDGNVTTPDLRANSITSSRIATGGVFGSDIADNSVTGTDLDEASVPGFKRVYFAKVNLDGTLSRGDATSSTRTNPGLYSVRFAVDFNYSCAGIATSRTQYSPTGFATTTVNSNYVNVRVTANGANADRPFDLVVVCP